jgi:hypothetical protein
LNPICLVEPTKSDRGVVRSLVFGSQAEQLLPEKRVQEQEVLLAGHALFHAGEIRIPGLFGLFAALFRKAESLLRERSAELPIAAWRREWRMRPLRYPLARPALLRCQHPARKNKSLLPELLSRRSTEGLSVRSVRTSKSAAVRSLALLRAVAADAGADFRLRTNAQVRVGHTLRMMGRASEALTLLDDARARIAAGPAAAGSGWRVLYDLGEVYRDLGRIDDASSTLSAALADARDDEEGADVAGILN